MRCVSETSGSSGGLHSHGFTRCQVPRSNADVIHLMDQRVQVMFQ